MAMSSFYPRLAGRLAVMAEQVETLLGMQPLENTLVARLTPPNFLSSAYGMKFILTFGVGALAVKMVEYVDARWGMDATFLALGLTSTLLVLSVVVLIAVTDRASVARPLPEK